MMRIENDAEKHPTTPLLMVVAAAAVFLATSATAETIKIDARLVLCSTAAKTQRSTQADGPLESAVRESAEKNELKPGSVMKKVFGDLRPGSCKSAAPSAPNTSWPARGDAAISFCKP